MIRWATQRPAAVWAVAVAILLAGAVSFTRLPLATRTEVELPQLQVSGAWQGASAELVEMYITAPVEAAIQGVRGVKRINSRSSEGRSQLTVELEGDADVRMARLAILERLELLREEFPPGSTPPSVENYVPQELDEEPLLFYTISGPYTPGSLERIANEQIVPRLGSVPGVAGVVAQGGAELGVSVSYNPQRLRQLGISPSDLVVAIREARMVEALGDQRAGSTARRVVLRDQPGALVDLARLPIRGAGGLTYHLGEIATVRQEEDARGFFFRVDGRPAVSMSVSRHPGADAINTSLRVRETLTDNEASQPDGIRLEVVDDGSEQLAKQLADLSRRGAMAFILVALVLAVALRNAKSIVLVLGSAAVAIAGTALGLYLMDIPANLLTLAGLGMGIGILVQNGLIVVERLRRAPDTADGRAEAGRRILPALVGATLTTAVVLMPFLYLQGNARAAFMPFAAAFTLALGCSVISAVVMIPAVGAGLGEAWAQWSRLDRFYRKLMIRVFRFRWIVMVLALVTLAVLGWGFVVKVPRVDWGSYGQQRTSLSVFLGFPRGSDASSANQSIQEFEALAVGAPGVERVVTRGGNLFGGAQMQVWFRREDSFTGWPQQLQETLTQRAVFVGGVSVSVQGDGPGFSTGFGGGGSVSFRIRLLGYSFSGVEQLALDLKDRLERVSRVQDVDINAAGFFSRERAYEVTLAPDRAALARYGLTAADLAAAVAREVRGAAGQQLIEIDGEEFPVTLKTAGAAERTLDELRSALVPNARNAPVQIGDLARVGERETLANIRREDQQYLRILSYGFRGPTKLAQRMHDAFMASVTVPAGYNVENVEYTFVSDGSERGLWVVFGLGIILVLLVVAMVFDSVWAAAMVFTSLPLALSGVAAAFWIADAAFTREAAVGVILVIGLAVNQSILLVDAALERRRKLPQGRRGLSAAHLLAACRDRSGMILLVTFTTLASLLPLAVGAGSDSLFGAIALATSGGVIAGTIGALFVMPVVLLGVGRRT
jgi:HAE1 family hydrophobic/amphiphilic exporter-1